jgi:hypothetical protein
MNWETVFLITEAWDGLLVVVEREGVYLLEHKCWNVNIRETGCPTKLIQSIPEEKVYRTREVAEARLRELEGE